MNRLMITSEIVVFPVKACPQADAEDKVVFVIKTLCLETAVCHFYESVEIVSRIYQI